MNTVIAGEYVNKVVVPKSKYMLIGGIGTKVIVNAKTVKAYEVVNENSQKSAASGIARGIVGGALLGGVGAIAGAASGKSKSTHQVAVEFMNGKKSLLELDDKCYNLFLKVCFNCGTYTEQDALDEQAKFDKKTGANIPWWKKLLKGLLIFIGVIVGLIILLVILFSNI